MLRVERIGDDVVYRGRLAGTRVRDLGRLADGESRRYRFTVSFPDGGAPSSDTTGDNAYQRASVKASYVWALTAGELRVAWRGAGASAGRRGRG